MLKKIVIGGLASIVIGAAGVGAYDALQNDGLVTHTPRVDAAADGSRYQGEDRTDQVRHANNQQPQAAIASHDAGNSATSGQTGNPGNRGRQNAATAPTSGNASATTQNQGSGYRGGQGSAVPRGAADGSQSPQPEAQVDEWLTLTGTVVSVEQTGLTLSTADGTTLTLELGQPRFWSSQGVELQPGDAIEVLGFEADKGYGLVFQTASITRLDDGATVQLRDTDGRPLWAARGRGGH